MHNGAIDEDVAAPIERKRKEGNLGVVHVYGCVGCELNLGVDKLQLVQLYALRLWGGNPQVDSVEAGEAAALG